MSSWLAMLQDAAEMFVFLCRRAFVAVYSD